MAAILFPNSTKEKALGIIQARKADAENRTQQFAQLAMQGLLMEMFSAGYRAALDDYRIVPVSEQPPSTQ